jgi:hypothetical protein
LIEINAQREATSRLFRHERGGIVWGLRLNSKDPSERVGVTVRLGDIGGKKHQGYRVYSTKGSASP